MSDRPEPRDPAEVLRLHFTHLRLPEPAERRYVMSARHRARLEKLEQKVKQLRGEQ